MSNEQYFESCPRQCDQILLESSDDPNLFSLPVETPPPPPIFCNSQQNSEMCFADGQHNSNECFYEIEQSFLDVSEKNSTFQNKFLLQQTPFVNVSVVVQPVARCRFRYKAEQGPHGALKGVSTKGQKSTPKVKVESNFCGSGYVLASLWTNESPARPHVNELWGSDCENGFCKVEIGPSNLAVGFPNLGIMRQKEKDISHILLKNYLRDYEATGANITDQISEVFREKAQKEAATMKDCLHCVRLGFQAFLTDPNGAQIASPIVLSHPIYNSQNPGFSALQIAEVDRSYGCCSGGDVIWLRCATKIRRDQIKVKFCESSSDWEGEANFSPNDVYEQILIIFKTPPYKNISIREETVVNIRLFRTTDGEYSSPVNFVYLPNEDGLGVKRLRQNLQMPHCEPNSNNKIDTGSFFGSSNRTAAHLDERMSQFFSEYGTHSANHSKPNENFACCPCVQPSARLQNLSKGKKQPLEFDAVSSAKFKSLDSGIEFFKSIDTSESTLIDSILPSSLTSGIESLTLAEYVTSKKSLQTLQKSLRAIAMCQIEALWAFSSEGDLTSLVQANKNLISGQDELGNNAIHISAKSRQPFALKTMLKVLDESPFRATIINMQNHKGQEAYKKQIFQTPLHLAVRYGDPDCVHYLLKSGSDLSIRDLYGNSVVHYLAETFNESIYRDFLFPPRRNDSAQPKIDLNILNNEGISSVHLAVKRNKLALLESLIDANADLNLAERNTGKTALHMAIETGDLDVLKLLLQRSAMVDQEMHNGTTALQLAVLLKRDVDILQLLLDAGADANIKTSTAKPPMMGNGTDDEVIFGRAPNNQKYCAMDFIAVEENGGAILMALKKANDVASSTNSGTLYDSQYASTSNEHRFVEKKENFEDKLCMLDFLTRLRLSKLLDKEARWERLAAIFDCDPQMVECLRICAQTESSSATSFLLDQLEQIPHFTINELMQALNRLDFSEAADLVRQRLWKK